MNATTLNGAVSASQLPLFGASGSSHRPGAVPDPGATAGTTRFLREDGSWAVPAGGQGGSGTAGFASFSVNSQGGACANGIALCVNTGSTFTVDSSGNEISNSIETASGNIRMADATGGTLGYSNIALNGNNSNGSRIGLVGGGPSTGDMNMYVDVPTGGNFVFRVGGTAPTCTLGTGGLICGGGVFSATSYHEALSTPASSSASCSPGDFTDDANFHYVCTATNTWKRAALSSF